MSAREPKHYLKEWRKYRDLTQEELGDKVGRTKSAVQKVESFRRDLGSDWASLLAPALSIEPADLFSPPPGFLPSGPNATATDVDEVQRIHSASKQILADTTADDKAHWELARHILDVRRKYQSR